MKRENCKYTFRAALVALAIALATLLPGGGVKSQTVTPLPTYINPGTTTDMGNGPIELRVVQGNALIATSSGGGTGKTTGSSTALVLDVVPAVAPCIGCVVTGNAVNNIPAGVTVISFNGVTTIGLSSALALPASSPVLWGGVCPTVPGAVLPIQASVGGDFPLFTTARICAYSPNGPGAAVLPFAIGSH